MVLRQLEAEADEMWSFVKKKANKQWIWIAMDAITCQDLAFHVGDRSRNSAKELWAKIPAERHRAITKKSRKTNHIERFNNTLRQRVSRLVRETLSFSKKLAHYIGAIKYFICYYNLTRVAAAALPV